VLFHPQLLTKLISSPFDDALLVDFANSQLGEEEMKVKVSDGRVVDIRKDMDPAEADGENVGIVKFSARGAKRLIEEMDALISRGHERDWAPRAFRQFATRFPLHAISTDNYPWIEIDFPEDYRKAQEEIFPNITALADSRCL
jgi:choline kinase